MKIVEVEPIMLTEWRPMLFVRVETEDGLWGIGEAGLTSREPAVAAMISTLTEHLVGQPSDRIEHLWQMMWRSGFHPSGQVLTSAIAAIDLALWDIKAKRLGIPACDLLGGQVRDRIDTYCHIKGSSPDELVASARRAVSEGWKFLRWELFEDADGLFEPQRAIERNLLEWRILREELGDTVELCVDLHTKLSAPDAIRYCRAVERYRPFFIEDPVRSEHPEGYRRVRAQTSVPLAAGEQMGTKWQLRSLIEEELVDYLRVDLCIAGGLTEARKLAAMCEAHMMDIILHNPIGPVSTAACVEFNLGTSNSALMELPRRPGETLTGAIQHHATWRDGCLHSSDAPGLGLDVDWDALRAISFVPRALPVLHRADGSFTNW
ncbi:MAG TPA: mandelate racemase/muconate lactonizing enzyme family protein [Devosiaceae bacterium]